MMLMLCTLWNYKWKMDTLSMTATLWVPILVCMQDDQMYIFQEMKVYIPNESMYSRKSSIVRLCSLTTEQIQMLICCFSIISFGHVWLSF